MKHWQRKLYHILTLILKLLNKGITINESEIKALEDELILLDEFTKNSNHKYERDLYDTNKFISSIDEEMSLVGDNANLKELLIAKYEHLKNMDIKLRMDYEELQEKVTKYRKELENKISLLKEDTNK